MIGYIYKIENTQNGKFYVGSTKDPIKRKSSHKRRLQQNCHFNQYLQNAYNIDKGYFQFIIIEECEIDKILEREQYYIDLLKPQYNINKIASYNNGKAISHGKKGKTMNSESIRKMAYTKFGQHQSIESNTKRSITMMGKNAGKNNNRSIPIIQLTLNGEFIKEWESRGDIERKLDYSGANIYKVCTNKYNQAYGYKWQFKQLTNNL